MELPTASSGNGWESILLTSYLMDKVGLLFQATLAFGVLGQTIAFAQGPFKQVSLSFQLKDGTQLEGILKVPTVSEKALPFLMIFGGFKNAANVLELVHTKESLMLGTFDYPTELSRQKFEFPSSLKFAPQAKKMIHQMIEAIPRFYQAVNEQFRIDPQRSTILGGSLGAPFAVYAGAREPRLNGVIIVHGFGQARNTISRQFELRWPSYFGRLFGKFLGWLAWHYVDIPEIESAVSRFDSKKKVLMITAKQDENIPHEAVDSLWRALGDTPLASRKRVDLKGEHLRPGAKGQLEEILETVALWMQRQDLLLPKAGASFVSKSKAKTIPNPRAPFLRRIPDPREKDDSSQRQRVESH